MADKLRYSNNQSRAVKGTVGKHGFVKTTANSFKQLENKAEKVVFSLDENNTGMAVFKAAVTTAKATAETAFKTAYVTHKVNYTVGGKIVTAVKGGIKFGVNPVMSDGKTYRNHLKTRVVKRVRNLTPVRAFTITKNGVKTAAGAVRKTYRVTKSVAKGDIKMSKEVFAYAGKKVAKTVGQGTVGVAKSTAKTAVHGLKTSVRFAPKTASAVGGALSATGNEYLSAAGTAIHTTVQGGTTAIKTAAVVTKTTGKTIKTGFSGFRKVRTGFSYVKQNGLRKSARRLGKRTASKVGSSIVKGFMNLFTFGLRATALPAIIAVVVVIMGAATIVTTIGAAVNAIFGTSTSIIDDAVEKGEEAWEYIPGGTADVAEAVAEYVKKEDSEIADEKPVETSEEEWLIKHIKKTKEKKREEVKKILEKDLVENGGDYHEIRFYNGFTDEWVSLTDEKDSTIDRSMYSDEQMYELIQPIFHNILLVKYDLVAKESDMIELYNEMVEEMMTIEKADTDTECSWTEWCSQGEEPKTDSPVKCSECGHVHAEETCLNVTEGNHGDDNYTCSTCCHKYYKCKGHKGDLKCGMQEHDHSNIEDAFKDWTYKYNHGGVSTGAEYGGWILTGWNADFTYLYYNCKYGGGGSCGGHHHNDWHSKDDSGCYKTMYHHADGSYNEFEPSGDDIRCESPCDNCEEHSYCTGYRHCEGHKIEKVYFKSVDTNRLLDKYYDDEIKELEKKKEDGSITTDETKRLKQLNDNRKIVSECIENLARVYGNDDKDEDVKGEEIVDWYAVKAYAQLGTPYVVGGDDLETGVDDIGFICAIFNDGDVEFKHDYTSIATDEHVTIIGAEDISQGDIVFYSYGDDSSTIYHVGIAIGNNLMVHASNAGSVRVSKIYKEAVHFVGKVS